MKDIDKQIFTYLHAFESLAFPGLGMFQAFMPRLTHFPVFLQTFRIVPKRSYHFIKVIAAEFCEVMTCPSFLYFLSQRDDFHLVVCSVRMWISFFFLCRTGNWRLFSLRR